MREISVITRKALGECRPLHRSNGVPWCVTRWLKLKKVQRKSWWNSSNMKWVLPWPMVHSSKFHENQAVSFCIILLTDKQTKTISLAEVNIEDLHLISPPCGLQKLLFQITLNGRPRQWIGEQTY